MEGQEKTVRGIKTFLKTLVTVVLFIIYMFPFYMIVLNAFKHKRDIIKMPLSWGGKRGFTTDNFVDAFQQMNFMNILKNSLIITCVSVFDHSVLLHGSLHLRKKSMEDQPDHLHGNAVFHGNPVPGSYDPADLYLRWNIWNPEPQSNIDIHASGLLGIYGGIHVPWIYQRRCTDLTGRGSTD